jgi:hypothetical protein
MLLPGGNGYLLFSLIVFTLAFVWAWKTGVLFWIPWQLA